MEIAETDVKGSKTEAPEDKFEQHRPLLFSIAYRMLGSVADAEDIIQEAYFRWHRTRPNQVESSRSYLCAIVTRLCIDHLRSARVRREEYVGPWLPEPLVAPVDEDPLEAALLAESLSTAFLLLLERLTEMERAVFLLRDVFSFDYPEVARIVRRSDAATRQIAKRARDRLAGGATRFTAAREEAEHLVHRFVDACTSGDLDGLLELLTEDAVTLNDGGGKVLAALKPIYGRQRVARFYVGIFRKFWAQPRIRVLPVNGQPGILVRTIDGMLRVLTFAIRNGRIEEVFLVVNPDKLLRVPPEA